MENIKEVHKDNSCSICLGQCCFRNLINVCGYDVWTTSRTLDIRPTDFLAFAQLVDETTPYNFRLDSSDRSYYLALNMNEQPDGSRRCLFGLSLPREQFRCGIYPLRPITCRAYPFILAGGEPEIKEWALCPDGAWDLGSFGIPLLKEELGRFQMEFCIYGLVVARWNDRVVGLPPLEKLDFRPFVSFVMRVYDELALARAIIPSDDWPEIWNRWRESMATGINPLWSGRIESRPPSWERWLESVEEAVRG